MTEQHPITPPQELVQLWLENYFGTVFNVTVADASSFIATQTAQWIHEQRGASNEAELQKARDEELEACCKWIEGEIGAIDPKDLFTARRPKSPSLKEQALIVLYDADLDAVHENIIRRALEALPDE